MSHAYISGYRTGKRRLPACCPYEGHTAASMELQLRWRTGYFDGLTSHARGPRKRKHLTRRKTVRVRWPTSTYARERVLQLLGTP